MDEGPQTDKHAMELFARLGQFNEPAEAILIDRYKVERREGTPPAVAFEKVCAEAWEEMNTFQAEGTPDALPNPNAP